jgi:hypothetical protein
MDSWEFKYLQSDQKYTSKRTLVILNIAAVSIHLVDGILGSLLTASSNDVKFDVVAPLVEYVTSSSGSFFKKTPKKLFSTSAFWPSNAVEFITAAFHVIYLLQLWYADVESFIRRRIADTSSLNALRWVEYAVTATLMTTIGSVAIGIDDFYYFIRNITAGVVLQFFGYILELIDPGEIGDKHAPGRRLAGILWNVATILNLSAVFNLLYQTFASNTHNNLHLFIENTIPFAIWFNTFGIIAWFAFTRYKQFVDRYFVEKYYILLSLSTKVAVHWLSFGTYRYIAESEGFVSKLGVNWTAVRWSAIFVPAIPVVASAVMDARQWRTQSGKGRAEDGELKQPLIAREGAARRRTKKSRMYSFDV